MLVTGARWDAVGSNPTKGNDGCGAAKMTHNEQKTSRVVPCRLESRGS